MNSNFIDYLQKMLLYSKCNFLTLVNYGWPEISQQPTVISCTAMYVPCIQMYMCKFTIAASRVYSTY